MSALTVVIVNYHGAHLVAEAVASLETDGPGAVGRIVLVDNSDDAEQRTSLATVDAPVPVTVLDSGGNVGFGAAVNRGIEAAALGPDDRVWVLNPDVVVAPGAQAALARVLDSAGSCLVSPVITHDDTPTTWWFRGGSFDAGAGRVEHDGLHELVGAPATGVRAVSFLTGAAVMTTGATWSRLGGFREDLFLYWEDVELSIRAARCGVELLVCDDAVVRHRVGAGSSGGSSSAVGMSAVFYYYNARNRVRVLREVYGGRALLAPAALVETARMLARPVRRERGREMPRKTWRGLRGLLAGLTEPAVRPRRLGAS